MIMIFNYGFFNVFLNSRVAPMRAATLLADSTTTFIFGMLQPLTLFETGMHF